MVKETTISEIKNYYDNKNFDTNDIKEIAKGTTKEDELFDYADVSSYLKTSRYSEKENDEYEISR